MKTPECPYCNSQTRHILSQKDINRKTDNTIFHLNNCNACDLYFVTNPPDDLGPYYHQDYHYIPEDRSALEKNLPGQRSKIDILLPYKSTGKLLEIGPSVGYFCALAQDTGFDVSAIEMDEKCIKFLSEELGVNAIQSNDPAQVLNDDTTTYDAICLWHSIEHLPSPWDVLRLATQRLNPGGIILIAAPNPNSRQAKMMGKFWPHHDLPRHLFGMSPNWMEKRAHEFGLNTLVKTTRDKESLYWNRFSWAMKFRALTLWAPHIIQRLSWIFGLQFAKLFALWEDKESHGSCYVTIFQKPEDT